MQSGRIEHRMAANLEGRLESALAPLYSEGVSITNISSHGARVLTTRTWQPHDPVVLIENTGDFRVEAEVIYCRRLHEAAFAIGLKFGRAGAGKDGGNGPGGNIAGWIAARSLPY
jgi:hypothetical protein